MKIRLLETAKEDLRQGWRFYERVAIGLGEYYLESIQADVRSLNIYAGIHENAEGFRGCLPKDSLLPYTIYSMANVLISMQFWTAVATLIGLLRDCFFHRKNDGELFENELVTGRSTTRFIKCGYFC